MRSAVVQFLLAAVLWSACRTAPPPAVDLSAPGWHVQQGQAVWRSSKDAPAIAGELLVATHPDGGAFLQFTKTPLPVIVAQAASNSWRIEFARENRVCTGRGTPSEQFSWLQLARCLAGAPPAGRWRWQGFAEGRWRLENRISGETLEGYLTP